MQPMEDGGLTTGDVDAVQPMEDEGLTTGDGGPVQPMKGEDSDGRWRMLRWRHTTRPKTGLLSLRGYPAKCGEPALSVAEGKQALFTVYFAYPPPILLVSSEDIDRVQSLTRQQPWHRGQIALLFPCWKNTNRQ